MRMEQEYRLTPDRAQGPYVITLPAPVAKAGMLASRADAARNSDHHAASDAAHRVLGVDRTHVAGRCRRHGDLLSPAPPLLGLLSPLSPRPQARPLPFRSP